MHIEDISQENAVIRLDIAGECIWAEVTLDHECERMRDDDFKTEIFWDEYTPIITEIHGLDEYGEIYPMPQATSDIIEYVLDCDEFYKAFQAQFSSNFVRGKSVSHYY